MAEIELEDQPATTTEATTKKPRKPRKPKTEATPEPQDVQEATQEVQGEADATQNVQSTIETPEAAQNASQTASAKSDELAEADRYEAKLKAAEEKIRIAQLEIELLKSQLKTAKAEQEERVVELCQIVREGRRAGESLPLFDRKPEPAATEAPKPSVKLHEPWREWSLAKIGLSDSIVEKLAEAGYATAGQIADFANKGGILTDITGIGEATADKIDDALAEMHRIKPWEVDGSVDVVTATLSLGPEGMRLEDSAGDEEPGDETGPETEVFEEDELD